MHVLGWLKELRGQEKNGAGCENIHQTAFGAANLMAKIQTVLSPYTCESYLKVAERLESSSLNLSLAT